MVAARYLWLPGPVSYPEAHALQRWLVAQRADRKIPDTVLLLEHAETITVGRRGGAEANVVAAGDVPVVRVERGGDVTWHGPGQLVAYPIVGLEGPRADLHDHLRRLESAVIGLLSERGLPAARDARNTGVWLGGRKVCAIGIACRRWVTWHGLALNVSPDLGRYTRIRPCGFDADTVTRVCDHLSPCPPLAEWVEPVAAWLGRALDLAPGPVERGALGSLAE